MVTTDDQAGRQQATRRRGPARLTPRPPGLHAAGGFFTGLLFVLLVPSVYAGVLSALADDGSTSRLFPFVLVALALPVGLAIAPHTRRFGRYMLLGVVSTAVVVLGVAALVVWFLVSRA